MFSYNYLAVVAFQSYLNEKRNATKATNKK